MKSLHFFRLFAFLLVFSTIFNACTKDSLLDDTTPTELTEEQSLEALLSENGFSEEDIAFFNSIETEAGTATGDVEVAATRNSCQYEICANFTGTGRYRVILPNGTVLFFRLSPFGNSVSFNGGQFFPFPGNQYCATINVNMSATANLAFKGSGSVMTTAQLLPGGTPTTIFSVSNGSDIQDVTLTCPPDDPDTCQIEICGNFTGTGKYRVQIPNGTVFIYSFSPFGYTVSVNGGPASGLIPGNQICETITIPVGTNFTAGLAFKGTGSILTTAEWIGNSQPCTIFSASNTSTSTSVTLNCNPIC